MLDAVKKHAIPIIIIAIVTLTFFAKLFFPEPKMFFTSELGGSDLWYLNYPLKDVLSSSLKAGKIPFWEKGIGNGFPLFDEGQIGYFYLPNIILFASLPTWLAFNLSYIFTFFISFLGCYLLFTYNKLSRSASLFAAFSFSFSGFFITHINHFNLIQSASLIPWLFLASQKLWENPNRKNGLLVALLVSQQIFTGSPPPVLIGLVGITIFYASLAWFMKKKETTDKAIKLFLSLLLGFLLASPQILPTAKLTLLSVRKMGLPIEEIYKYPYPLKHLITFISPNFFGNPKTATYPPPSQDWGLFWENTTYLGILPLLFFAISILKKNKSKLEKSFITVLVISSLLAIGKKSALLFLLPLPGLSYFRIPARFLLLASLAISFLSAHGFDLTRKFIRKRHVPLLVENVMIIAILIFSFTNIYNFANSYHSLIPVKTFLNPPETARKLSTKDKIYTHPEFFNEWNKVFFSQGWQTITPYVYLNNGLNSNFNLLFKIPQFRFSSGTETIRQKVLNRTTNLKIISAFSVKYIISPKEYQDNQLPLVEKINPPTKELPTFYIYKNTKSLDRIRFATNYIVSESLEETQNIIKKDQFSFANTAVLEKDPNLTFGPLKQNHIEILKDEDQKLVIKTVTDKSALLILADSYYPGWRAKINRKPVQILPANINQRALIVPAGTNTIEMKYIPYTFYAGLIISFTSISIIIFKGSTFKQAKKLRKKNPDV